jgi:hypothetical protein
MARVACDAGGWLAVGQYWCPGSETELILVTCGWVVGVTGFVTMTLHYCNYRGPLCRLHVSTPSGITPHTEPAGHDGSATWRA